MKVRGSMKPAILIELDHEEAADLVSTFSGYINLADQGEYGTGSSMDERIEFLTKLRNQLSKRIVADNQGP